MTYILVCFVESCSEVDYLGTMKVIAAYARCDYPDRSGYIYGIRERSGIQVDGASFHILAPDLRYDAVTSDGLVQIDGDGPPHVRTDGFRRRDLKALFVSLMGRSGSGKLYVVLDWNGAASCRDGPPLPHQALTLTSFLQLIEENGLHESMLYIVTADPDRLGL